MDNLSTLAQWASTNTETGLFYLLAVLIIPLAFAVIFDRSVIRSGFLLIAVFGLIAGLFMLLQAQFLALAQIMIYAVGITLVVVIALMLTNPKLESEESPTLPKERTPGFITALLVFATIYLALNSQTYLPMAQSEIGPQALTKIGVALTTTFSLPFEFASVLLLAALVGAIMLAKAEAGEGKKRSTTEPDVYELDMHSSEREENVVQV